MIRSHVCLILGCPAIGWSWLAIMISSRNFASLGMYVRFFHFTSPSCLVQGESFFSNLFLANHSSLYCRLVICDVILIEATALMDIGDKGGEKRVSGKKVCDLLSISTPFQSLASWTEDWLGLFFERCEITRWYSQSICYHLAWWRERSWGLWKNSRFLWSVNISTGWDASRR